jgi:hypothetical protein
MLFNHQWYYKHGSAVVDLEVPEGGSLTICGDVHGQLDDALTIFRLNGARPLTVMFIALLSALGSGQSNLSGEFRTPF